MELLRELLPGPVTVVLRRTPALNPELNPGTDLVGLRVPAHPFVRQVARQCCAAAEPSPLALTSANKSNETSAIRVQEFAELWPRLAHVFDGGHLYSSGGDGDGQQGSTKADASEGATWRSGSTVVDLSHDRRYRIIRAGCALEATVRVLEDKYGFSALEA